VAVIIHKMDSVVEVDPGAEGAGPTTGGASGAANAPPMDPGTFRDRYAATIREIVRDELARRARNAD
jgi:hypothetical protein